MQMHDLFNQRTVNTIGVILFDTLANRRYRWELIDLKSTDSFVADSNLSSKCLEKDAKWLQRQSLIE